MRAQGGFGAGNKSGSTRFRRSFRRMFWEALVQAPGQVQQGSGEGFGRFGRLWCRCQVKFNKVPEKVAEKVPEKVLGDAGAGARESFGKLWCRRRVRFNKVPEVPEKVSAPGQVQPGSREGSGEGFGKPLVQAPGQVQQGSGEGSREGFGRLWCRRQQGSIEDSGEGSGRLWCSRVRSNKVPGSGAGARSGSRRFWEGSGSRRFQRRSWKALMESEARFNEVPPEKVPQKVPEEVPEGLGAEAGQVQRRSGKGGGEGSREGLGQVQ